MSDPKGLTVEHDVQMFEEGSEHILTLKDSTILENEDEGDILTSVALEDKERLKKNLENKKRKHAYVAYDDEEFTLGGKKRNILSQYDEPTKSSFKLDDQGTYNLKNEQSVSDKLKAQAVNLSYEKMREIRDYYTKEEAEMTFKKPKTKKKKKVRRKTDDDEDDIPSQNNMDTQINEVNGSHSSTTAPKPRPKANLDDVNFVDDDDLQQALARARRVANKKRVKKMTPEDIARSLAENKDNGDEEGDEVAEGMLVLSDTAEFVRSLGTQPLDSGLAERESERGRLRSETPRLEEPEEVETGEMEEKKAYKTKLEDVSKDEDIEEGELGNGEDVEMETEEHLQKQANPEKDLPTGLEEEPLVASGMAATLALLQQKGLYQKPTEDELQSERRRAENSRWLTQQKRLDLERERRREKEKQREREQRSATSSSRGRTSERDRDYEKEQKERERLREVLERMRDYKPEIRLEHRDEFGRVMSEKEAYKHLSHVFHGKNPGKAKTEKRLQRLAEEHKLQAMSSVDTPLGMAGRFAETLRASGSAHLVLDRAASSSSSSSGKK
ncbi:uncharacterized protein VTP21DRAFT_38 [Calcarisporiella thermophila]|uniref:uncharacterized protein n=1 Tax=Calcarisporiella thermophila TaxID=911321 RepID=UPI0037424ABC